MAALATGLGQNGANLSILIPTFDCAGYLRETLHSLRQQTRGFAAAQILVVDDCSTQDDPERVLDEFPDLNAGFFRKPRNGGAVRNFNTCLELAERAWVYILHGDDVALPGALEEVQLCLDQFPEGVDAVFARAVLLDATGRWTGVTRLLGSGMRGLLAYEDDLWRGCPVQFSGIVVRRETYGRLGPFREDFTHVADWNMWWRIAKTARVAYSNRCVGGYRIFKGNHTSTLMRSGRNHREMVLQIDLLAESAADRARRNRLYETILQHIVGQTLSFVGDAEAFADNYRNLDLLPPGLVSARLRARVLLARLRQRVRWRTRTEGPVR